MKVNVITINTKHLYNDFYFVATSLSNNSVLNIEYSNAEDNSIKSNGVFVSTFETEPFPDTFSLLFESLKGVDFIPDGSISCSIYEKKKILDGVYDEVGTLKWSNTNVKARLDETGIWCNQDNYQMNGDGTIEYTIVLNLDKQQLPNGTAANLPRIFIFELLDNNLAAVDIDTDILSQDIKINNTYSISTEPSYKIGFLDYSIKYINNSPTINFTALRHESVSACTISIHIVDLTKDEGIMWELIDKEHLNTDSFSKDISLDYENKVLEIKLGYSNQSKLSNDILLMIAVGKINQYSGGSYN